MLNRNNFAIAELAEKTTGCRHSNLGLKVEPNQTIATDGHVLIIMSGNDLEQKDFPLVDGIAPVADFEPFQVSRADGMAIAKSIPNSKMPICRCLVIEPNCNNVKVGTHDGKSQSVRLFAKVEETFPNVNVVRKDKKEYKAVVSFDARLMINLLKAMMPASEKSGIPTITLRIEDEYSAIRLDATDNNQTVEAYLMPVRLAD